MKTWDEMIKRLDDCPKVNEHEIIVDGQMHQVMSYQADGIDKEEVMHSFVKLITQEIGDDSYVYVRVMPEINHYKYIDRYIAYARLVVIPKVMA